MTPTEPEVTEPEAEPEVPAEVEPEVPEPEVEPETEVVSG